jgi:hypothetical protein
LENNYLASSWLLPTLFKLTFGKGPSSKENNVVSISLTCLFAAFMQADPKNTKRTDSLTVFFALLGSVGVKAACKM